MMLLHVFNPKAIKNSCDFDLSPIFFVESPDMEEAMKIVLRENVNMNLDDYFISSPVYDKKYEEEFIRSFIAYKLSTCIEDPGYYKNNSNKVFGIVYYHNNDIRNIVYSDMEDHINYFILKNEIDQVSIEIEKLKDRFLELRLNSIELNFTPKHSYMSAIEIGDVGNKRVIFEF